MTAQGVERKLAAILSADVVGFSRLMGDDEEGTLAVLKTTAPNSSNPRLPTTTAVSSRRWATGS